MELHGKFATKDVGNADFYMECHITCSREIGTIKFNQHIFVVTIAERYEVTQATVIPAAPAGLPLSNRNNP